MREVINIHIGQAGVQLGQQCWELFCIEHGISLDGSINPQKQELKDDTFEHFFTNHNDMRFVPRSIFVDTDPEPIDEIRTGKQRRLFHPEQLISEKEGTSSIFAAGYYSQGEKIINRVLDRVRKLADECTGLQGFILYHSLGGGTGSGLGSLITERLSAEYGKKSKVNFAIHPSVFVTNSILDSYNAVLAQHAMIEHIDCSFTYDNEALYDLCYRNLGLEQCSFGHMNEIISQTVSSATASLRFDGTLNVDLTEFQTNLVPYPRAHFCTVAYAPILQRDDQCEVSTVELSMAAFQSRNALTKCDLQLGKYMSCCLMYRGDVARKEVGAAICQIKTKRTINFVDWCPTGFKCGINYQPPSSLPNDELKKTQRTCLMIANTTAISQVFQRTNRNFDLMLSRHAFVHWFVQNGMEETQLVEAREDMAVVEKDYEEIVKENDELEDDEF
uniref:Tubulin alpha chain n=1 Tax=Trepomonas sp. PC1 TaxID=1076344 RepID=A0A146K8P9_9EUKA|eukprot:JAP93193.1 Alpha-tubulin [Trepomonas sp. PC1]